MRDSRSLHAVTLTPDHRRSVKPGESARTDLHHALGSLMSGKRCHAMSERGHLSCVCATPFTVYWAVTEPFLGRGAVL